MGLRNQYLDSYLPPRRKQQRHQPAEEEGTPRRKLNFLHYPITDLDIPTPDQCASIPCTNLREAVYAYFACLCHCCAGMSKNIFTQHLLTIIAHANAEVTCLLIVVRHYPRNSYLSQEARRSMVTVTGWESW